MDEGAERTNAFVSVEDNNGKVYQISYRNLDSCQDTDLLESNLASDLINYQSLFRFQIPHSEQTSSLIDVFEYSVFPHLSFPAIHYHGKTLRNVKTMIKEYDEGPGYTTNAKGERIIVYKNSQDYNDFLALEAHLNGKSSNSLILLISTFMTKFKSLNMTLRYIWNTLLPHMPRKIKV